VQLLNRAAVFLILFLIAPLHAEVENRYNLIGPRQAELVNRYDELVRAVRADDHELITNLVNEMYGGKFPSDNTILLLGSDLPTFKLLERLGARTDVRDRRGMDVLLIAAQNGELDLVKYLI